MHFIFIVFTLIFFFLCSNSEASVDLGVSIGDEGLRGFYLAVGDYYRVPEKEVIINELPRSKLRGIRLLNSSIKNLSFRT
jgi:hypothetical protein